MNQITRVDELKASAEGGSFTTVFGGNEGGRPWRKGRCRGGIGRHGWEGPTTRIECVLYSTKLLLQVLTVLRLERERRK